MCESKKVVLKLAEERRERKIMKRRPLRNEKTKRENCGCEE